MCGIVGYSGSRSAAEVILNGLKKLEYRGYDSAGIALLTDSGIYLKRSTGKLINLENIVAKNPVSSNTGIGHTRWATHGKPSEENAHPHQDCSGSITLVHNGIIENYKSLKNGLEGKGHIFDSETDTEVIAHLIEEAAKTKTPDEAFFSSLGQLEGSYAVTCIFTKQPDRVYFAKNGSPLVLGRGSGENIAASDIPALLAITNKIIILEDGESGFLTAKEIHIRDEKGNRIEKPITEIDWSPVAAEKGGYKHFMQKEIFEGPQVVTDTFRDRLSSDNDSITLDGLGLSDRQIQALSRIYITACGTSFYAGQVGKYFFESVVGLPVEIDISSEMRYRDVRSGKNDLLIAISQSGETKDTLCSVEELKKKNIKVISVCNVMGSTIARKSDGVIYTRCGPEIGVASTKAFLGQITALFLIALYFAKVRNSVAKETYSGLVSGLRHIPQKILAVLRKDEEIIKLAHKYFKYRDFLFLGRAINFPIAMEGALKLKEISYIHAEGYAAGEMKHGPIALIDESMPVVAVATDCVLYEKMHSNMIEAKSRGAKIISIATEGNKDIASISEDVIYVPAALDLLSPLVNVVPLQLLAYHIAVLKGCDVDQPRNLAKSVTVE